jgi:hypothetical protein
VSISKIPATQTERAAQKQPNCFSGFATVGELIDRVTVRREMVCQCGGNVGILQVRQGWDGIPWADPLTFICLKCSSEKEFFNSHRDGYDNVMGNGATSTQGEKIATVACPSCNHHELIIFSDLLYNIEAKEIDEELSGLDGFGPEDCFDAFNSRAKCKACNEQFYVGGWELA